MAKMLKADLMKALADKSGQTQVVCDSVLKALASIVPSAVLDNDMVVTLPDIGTFKPKHRKARTGKNPKTGEALQIPASTVIGFKPHGNLVKAG